MSLVVAPAGSGKTVLLSQWATSRDDLRFVWVDIDSSDDDPVVLVKKVRAGVVDEIPQASGFPSIAASGLRAGLLEVLDAANAASPSDIVVVFDDVHNLTNRAIVDDIGELSDHLPPGIHFVLSSRTDLRLQWGRRRLRHAPVELRQAELAFDAEIVDEVLERISGTTPSATITNAVLERTEGWAAGVQLTAITLRHKPDPEKFAAHLAGSDRLIADYLSEEVLRAQSDERRDLLLRMSVLDRISAGLVEAISGRPDAGEILAELESDSMFLVPLDEEHAWFRFHPLFRDLLRYRLRVVHPGEDARLLVLAAGWHLDEGDIGEAIECLLQAREWDRAIRLILTRGREAFERGETASMCRWLGQLPAQILQANDDAEVLYGMLLAVTGQYAKAEDVLGRLVGLGNLPIGHALVAQTHLGGLVQFRPDPEVPLAAALRAVELLEGHPHVQTPDLLGITQRNLLEMVAVGSAARAHFLLGDFAASRRWMTRAASTSGAQYSVYRVDLLGSMALLDAWTGHLKRAQSLADEALHLAADIGLLRHPATADAYLAVALTAVERGDPLGAAFALHEGVARAAANQRTQLSWIGHSIRVLAHGDTEEGTIAAPPVSPPPIVRARLARLEGVRVGASPMRSDDPLARVETLIDDARVSLRAGRAARANADLERALELAEHEGLVDVFARSGQDITQAVTALPGRASAFRVAVLARIATRGHPEGEEPAIAQLSEPLTDRERELLVYLPSRLTNAELAARCFVSVNTIKTHMAHIYRKLDAPNRDAAIARAQLLGLL